jgi:hypothetical protein
MREFARTVFAGKTDQSACQDCGGLHARACPRIQAVRAVINGDGVVIEREVSYWAPGTWEKYVDIFPEEAYYEDDPRSSE